MRFSFAIAGIVLLQTWILRPIAGERWVPVLAVAVIALGVVHAWRAGDWGWSTRAFLPGLARAGLFTGVFAIGLVAAARWMGDSGSRDFVLADMGWLLAWGGAQQWLLQTTFLREAGRVAGGRGWIVAPLLFGVLHLPNPFLTITTTLAAFGWCAIYRRHPNVVPLALSHAIGTRIILGVFDAATTGRLRVGYGYLQM